LEDWDGKLPVEGGIRRLDWAGHKDPLEAAAATWYSGKGVGLELARRLHSSLCEIEPVILVHLKLARDSLSCTIGRHCHPIELQMPCPNE